MKSRILWINLALCFIVFWQAYMAVRVWTGPDLSETEAVTSLSKTDPGKAHPISARVRQIPPEDKYSDIVGNNLFSSDRKEYVPETGTIEDVIPTVPEEKTEEIKPLDSKTIVLFGVFIMGDYKKALVKDTRDRPPVPKWVEKGDKLAGFLVQDIENDKILVSDKGKMASILLYDKENPKKRPSEPPKNVSKPKPDSVQNAGPAQTKGVQNSTAKDEYEIIQTPFGEFKRKKQ